MSHTNDTIAREILLQILIATAFVCILALPLYKAHADIQLVGTSTATGNRTAYNLALDSLSGGIDTAVAQDDLVIVVNAFNSTTTGNPGVSTAGFVELMQRYANDTNDINYSLSYKIMTASPDTSVSCNPALNAVNASVCLAYVFRGVDTSSPFDVASTSQQGINQEDINCPAITPVTDQAVVLCTGGAAGSAVPGTITWPATPAGLTGRTAVSADSGGAALALATYGTWSIGSGAFDVASTSMTMGTQAQDSWAAMSVALRPFVAPPPTPSRTIRIFGSFSLKIKSGRIILYGG